MTKITDPDFLYYSEYTFGNSIDPTIANDGNPAQLLLDYENKRFALTAPRFGEIASGLSSEMVGYGDTGGVTGQTLYSKFKNIWKEDPVAIRFPFPMEAITPESFEFINGWLPDDSTTSLQTGVNTSFITRKLLRDTGWAERSAAGNLQRKYFGAITLGQIALGPSGFGTVFYNDTDPGIQTSFTIDTDGSVDTANDRIVFDGIVGNSNPLSDAAYFYTGDSVVYQTDDTVGAITGITHNDLYYICYASKDGSAQGTVPVGAAHSITLHTTREDALLGINTVALTGSTPGEVITFTSAGIPKDFFFGVAVEGGASNEAFQFFSTKDDDGVNVLYDKTDYFKIFTREEAKTYSEQDLGQIGVSELNYQAYRLPLASANDPNVTILDGDGATTGIATAEYAGIGVSFLQTPLTFQVGEPSYQFSIVIDADFQPLQTVYSKIQYLLRQNTRVLAGASADGNINSLSGTEFENDFRLGAVQNLLLEFVGNDLFVRRNPEVFDISAGSNLGIFITNVRAQDINSIFLYDDGAVAGSPALFFPFVSQGNLIFNDNFTNDNDSRFWVFYDEDAQGAIPGLSTSLSQEAGTPGSVDGIINSGTDTAEFVVGGLSNHPFVNGQKVVAISTDTDPGIGITCALSFTQTPPFAYYVNARNGVANDTAQVYTDITETGTNSPLLSDSVIGVGLTSTFRLHYTYAESVANNELGINTIPVTASGQSGIVTFRQIDVNYSEANATIVREEDGNFLDTQPISASQIQFTYDYDNNSQRNRIPSGGTDPSNTYAPNVRAVAVGLQTGQYATATATITRTKGQTINVTGALERVYADPV